MFLYRHKADGCGNASVSWATDVTTHSVYSTTVGATTKAIALPEPSRSDTTTIALAIPHLHRNIFLLFK